MKLTNTFATWPSIWLQLRSFICPRWKAAHRLQRISKWYQWRIQDFPGGANSQSGCANLLFFAEHCMKMKEFWPPGAPLRSATGYTIYSSFSQCTKLAILPLLPTLYSHIFSVSFFYISGYNNITFKGYRLHWTSSFLMAHLKQKVAILAFLYCGEFVKNSIDMIEVRN